MYLRSDVAVCRTIGGHRNESCHAFMCATSRIHACDMNRMSEACHMCEYGSDVARGRTIGVQSNETCHAFMCVMWLMWVRHVTRVNIPEQWRGRGAYYRLVAGTSNLIFDRLFDRATWLIHMCDMTHSYVWHDSFICVTRLIHICDVTHSYVWLVHACANLILDRLFERTTWLIDVCCMTHSYVWRDFFMCVTWFLHMYDMTHSCVWRVICVHVRIWYSSACLEEQHDSFTRVTWLIQLCDGTHSYVWHDSFIHVRIWYSTTC